MSRAPNLPSHASIVHAAKPWLSRPNIVGLSVGAKTAQGRPTGDQAVIVHVVQKLPQSQLGPDDLPVPRTIDLDVSDSEGAIRRVSLPTDVIEVGELRLDVLDGRLRPAQGGYQIAADNIKGTGTLGVNIVWATRYRMLTNNHVISHNGNLGAAVYQPDGGGNNRLGTVDGYVPVVTYPSAVQPFPHYNHQDLAYCDIDPSIGSPAITQIGTPGGIRAAAVGEAIVMIGKQTGEVRKATIVSITLALSLVWPAPGTWAWFDSMIQLSAPVSQPGDSGSAYIALSDGKLVGLHVGGGSAYSFGCQLWPF